MNARQWKLYQAVNKAIYIIGIGFLITGMFLSIFTQPAQAAEGAIWTTRDGCGTLDQDVNHYSVGETVN